MTDLAQLPATPSTSLEAGTALVQALARQLGAELVETHLSWVLLAADDAYKIKKPLKLPFVDYGSLAARRHCCEEELRLNRRLAPLLYVDVLPIAGTVDAPLLGQEPAIEHAVHMRRFPAGALVSEQLATGQLAPAAIDRLALLIGDFHAQAPPASPASAFGRPRLRRRLAMLALRGARAACAQDEYAAIRHWLRTEARRLMPLWADRRAAGRVREGHGDLHLANLIVQQDGSVAAFDGIEFDPALRFIDVLDDAAFTVMDLAAQGRSDFAFRFLNGWLDCSGDHDGVAALSFAVVYRALVRAQVALLRDKGRGAMSARYLATALEWTQPRAPQLVITHGLPGSGKTTASQAWLERRQAIRLRDDVERKRLFGLPALADSRASGLDLYSQDVSVRTYEALFAAARRLLQAGWPVVLDAAFLQGTERARARSLARDLGVPFSILACEAPVEELQARLAARHGDASEADAAVLHKLLPVAQPLTDSEQESRIDTALLR